MQLQLDQAIEVLSQTPSVLNALLRHKSPAWLDARKSPEAFSPIDVLGHLILADQTNFPPRIQAILAGQAFLPFDRFDFQTIIANKTIAALLDEFAAVRAQSLQTLHELHLEPHHLTLPGTHPEFGAVTLSNLLSTWVVHDLTHINQIIKTMANQYTEAVGPWQAYLSILH